MALEKELETYKRELPGLLDEEGKFVVVCGDYVIGVYPSYEDALAKGYEQCGLRSFLVKKIQAVEQAQFISGSLNFSCPN